ncbi:MAG TPA: hypothetical protein VFT06_02135, partial [Flavisolibacter sp.]|nr:hypothetical protein [Flavisolibacter sp.]
MIKIFLERLSILCLLLCACGHAERATVKPAKSAEEKWISNSKQDAYSAISLDSADIDIFIADHRLSEQRARQLRLFYQNRNYQFAWFSEEGLSQQ